MLVLDNFIEFKKKYEIEIPWYHIGHLSLSADTDVTLCYLPRENDDAKSLDEIVISPINFESWNCLWRLNASFFERKGLVSSVLEVLRESDLSVLQAETVSSDNRALHQMEIIVDARRIIDRDKDVKEIELTRALERKLIAYCINDVELDHELPKLKVRQMKGLHSTYSRYLNLPKQPIMPIHDKATIKDRRIEISGELLEEIIDKSYSKYLLVSDTKERILRVFLAKENQGYTYVQIFHDDRVGAIAEIVAALKNDFDIINSLTKIKSQDRRSCIELLLKSTDHPTDNEEGDRRDHISKCLKKGSLKSYGISFGFPRVIGENCNLVSLESDNGQTSRRRRDNLINKDIYSIATKRKQDLEKKKNSALDSNDKRIRLEILEKIRFIEDDHGDLKKSIFVSFDFSNKSYFYKAKEVIEGLGFSVITGENPDEHITMRDSIVNKISKSDAFLGIWTGGSNQFSPWLLWELGAAQTLKKSFKLLIAPEVPTEYWQKINSESLQYEFEPVDFDDSVKRAIDALNVMINTDIIANKTLQRTRR